MLLSNWKRKL
uniref:Uncharacterized protein n=1 Tax=Rhizophora mucronata TaxID=61149 RepID=A0A2P2Q8M6_RHIMU